jgi:hypothetical protein
LCCPACLSTLDDDDNDDGRIGEAGIGQYDFNDIAGEVYPAAGGAIWEWTVSSLVAKATGKGTGPLAGFNRFAVEGGKITKVSIIFSNDDLAQIQCLK